MGQPSSSSRAILRERVASLPDQPGVYLFKDAKGQLCYVGKAASLRKRVASYFKPGPALSPRIAQMMTRVTELEVRLVPTETEALLLEAQLIKALKPRYNVAFRDDKSYPLLKVTREPFPRLLVARRRQADGAIYFGPYTDAGLMHEAVRFLRRVFPMRTCRTFPTTPCLEYHLGQCLAPCAAYISAKDYQRIVDDLVAFLRGERAQLLKDLARRMEQAARDRRFEDAARLRDQIQALTSVIAARAKAADAGPLEQLQAALKLPTRPMRIEAFDISNIMGTFAVGSMVVFQAGKPHKVHYRHFRIETVQGSSAKGGSARGGDDYAMMREVIRRRYSGTLATQLPFPDLILVDGGKGQLNAVCEALAMLSLTVPTMGLAKRFEHVFLPGQEEPIILLSTSPVLHLVQHIRDEAHRFAITYHRRLRGKAVLVCALHDVPGIGPRKAAQLLAHFGSVARLARASVEEIAQVARVSPAVADAVLARVGRPHKRIFRIQQ